METKTETSDLNLEKKEIGTVEIKICEETKVNNEEIKVNVTFKSPLIASLKTKLSYVYNKLMNLIACTTKTLDSTDEPTKIIDQLKNMKEPVMEKVEAAVEKVILEELTVAIEESQVIVEEQLSQPVVVPVVPVVPVVVEEPVSIEERI
jgi:hypothetical protein